MEILVPKRMEMGILAKQMLGNGNFMSIYICVYGCGFQKVEMGNFIKKCWNGNMSLSYGHILFVPRQMFPVKVMCFGGCILTRLYNIILLSVNCMVSIRFWILSNTV